jgi:hypothetical protein
LGAADKIVTSYLPSTVAVAVLVVFLHTARNINNFEVLDISDLVVDPFKAQVYESVLKTSFCNPLIEQFPVLSSVSSSTILTETLAI